MLDQRDETITLTISGLPKVGKTRVLAVMVQAAQKFCLQEELRLQVTNNDDGDLELMVARMEDHT